MRSGSGWKMRQVKRICHQRNENFGFDRRYTRLHSKLKSSEKCGAEFRCSYNTDQPTAA